MRATSIVFSMRVWEKSQFFKPNPTENMPINTTPSTLKDSSELDGSRGWKTLEASRRSLFLTFVLREGLFLLCYVVCYNE